ncbi:hypothetical protein JHK82_053412 [Glycine max]|nr:hypothetical protein JHK86_053264 [Glycine max]KAG4915775.1 hypothetical protein JHK87_053332 [Glycine soja]KAG4927715.1 hypothetical protein JHK85_054201 [Glycine max]KAG5083243.1 hypothetical protein JHK84_053281 [Glycine max]KAG5086015.1 hypothetical protein JHK82_053412 [Glycine max]
MFVVAVREGGEMEEKYSNLEISEESPNSGVFFLILNRPSRPELCMHWITTRR